MIHYMKVADINVNYVIELNKQGFSQNEIALKIGCVYQDVQRLLKYHNCKLSWKRKNKIQKNEDFFEKIDCEIKAYLLGFFYADGNIDRNLKRISLCISEKDIYIANLFKDYIAPNSLLKIIHNKKGAKNRKPQVFLRINSQKIVKDLMKYGLCPRKTYQELSFPNLCQEMIPHFIRGYFDGDGCVMDKPTSKGVIYNKVIFCINWKSFLDSMCDKIYHIGISKIFTKINIGKTTNWFTLAIWSHYDSLKFGKFIYNNANFFLQRKKEKFLFQNTEVNTENNISVSP